ncbi:hypothetical protein GCM10020254_73800 [Streptomyces goshikiensis]
MTPTPRPRSRWGALPLGHGEQELGCLIVAGEAGEGFSSDDRSLLELYADQVAAGLASVAARFAGRKAPQAHLSQSLVPDQGGAFILELGTGRIEAHAHVLDLLGLSPEGFDGQVETVLACAVPDDMAALMAIVEPDRLAGATGQQLAFRIRRPNGELRWLGLRCRVEVDAGGTPRRVLGVVADATYLRPSADEVSLVQRLSATLAGAATIREVSRLVVAALREPLGAYRVAVGELEPERLIVTALDPPEPDAWPEVWRSEWRSEWPDVPLNDLPTLRSAVRGGHMSLWPPGAALEPGLLGVGPGGLAVLPLPADGRMVGVCLVGWDTEHRFGPEERSLLTATAGLVGQALVRAHALDAGHELAAMLQRSLLPRKLPELAGGVAVARYLPATAGLEVGGDWYDVIPLSAGHVAFVIGDVQGHSAGAATIMGQILTAVRAYAVEGHPPDVVVARANRLLAGMETDLFATCAYVDLDMEEGIASFVRAGHLPPLLRHPDGVAEELAVEGGPPLGVLAEAEFPMTEVGLLPGTLLVLLTDGLVESARLHLEEGMRRVCEVLAAANPADPGRVADELVVGVGRRDDDVAVLLLRYDGTGDRPRRSHWTVWRLPNAVLHARRFTARTLRSWGRGGGTRRGPAGRVRAGHQRHRAHAGRGGHGPDPVGGPAADRRERRLAAQPRQTALGELGVDGRPRPADRRGDHDGLGLGPPERRQTGMGRNPLAPPARLKPQRGSWAGGGSGAGPWGVSADRVCRRTAAQAHASPGIAARRPGRNRSGAATALGPSAEPTPVKLDLDPPATPPLPLNTSVAAKHW